MATNGKQPDHSKEPSLLNFRREQSGHPSEHPAGSPDQQEEEVILTVGDRLRMAREERGLSLHQVAGILRLKATQVQALEDGDYNRLPGQTFVTGFLRSYANLLDLDAVLMVDLYKQEHSGGLRTPSLAFPEPSSEGRMPGKGILVATVMLALVFVAGWFVYQESGGQDFERVAELPDHLAKKIENLPSVTSEGNVADVTEAEPLSAPSISDVPAAGTNTESPGITATAQETQAVSEEPVEPVDAEATAEPQEPQTPVQTAQAVEETADVVQEPVKTDTAQEAPAAAEEPAAETQSASVAAEQTPQVASPPEQVAPVATAAVEETQPAAVKEVPSYPQAKLEPVMTAAEEERDSPLPRTFGVENTDARVVLRAREETWVEVKSADNPPYISQVLKPGDIYMAPNISDVTLTTGNAGALEVRVDGTEISALGANGAILRDISLVADSLLDGSSLN